MKNQVCKLFAVTDGAVTQDMSAMPSEILKSTLSNYSVSKKNQILIEVYSVQLNSFDLQTSISY